MALGMILVLFIAISVVSGLGILFLLLTKNEKVKKGMYYFLAVWGLVIAWLTSSSLPNNYMNGKLIAWGISALGVVGIFVYLKAGAKGQRQIAYAMVIVSVVAGVMRLFGLI